MTEEYEDAPYGYCPLCGAPGVATERRINGNTVCKNGHSRPRASYSYPTGKEQVEIEVGKNAKVGDITINKESKPSLLTMLEESISLQKLNNADHVMVINGFLANYATALLILKLQDIQGLKLINDHAHASLTKFSPAMSDLNLWARALFKSHEAEIKAKLGADEAKLLSSLASSITSSRVQKLMKVPLTAPDSVNWDEAVASILLTQSVLKVQSSYFNVIIRALYNWDDIVAGAKQKAINYALMFLLQSDPTSKLVPILRKLSSVVMLNKLSQSRKAVGFIKEDETVGASSAGTSTANIGTTNNAIVSPNVNSQTGHPSTAQDMQQTLGGLYKLNKMAPTQITKKGRFTIRNGKLILKKVKSYSPKKFKAPEFLKPVKQETTKENTNELE